VEVKQVILFFCITNIEISIPNPRS